ncbi:hypothetical protein L6452_41057 [Arctium lappa]|uniref:Uncharacterized protein n=1 Tax=Arctium lappa TaxID=4217 RepID=A0ACB8XP16_ARCLA|nr:hypothetical protein L6452_41057 [Arctium lappa]
MEVQPLVPEAMGYDSREKNSIQSVGSEDDFLSDDDDEFVFQKDTGDMNIPDEALGLIEEEVNENGFQGDGMEACLNKKLGQNHMVRKDIGPQAYSTTRGESSVRPVEFMMESNRIHLRMKPR